MIRTAYFDGKFVEIEVDENAKRTWTYRGKTVQYIDLPPHLQNELDDLMDDFEDGNNPFDGECETLTSGDFTIRRRASLS